MSGRRLFGLVGVFSAAIVVVCVNILVSRFYVRWDFTSRGLYTLSDATIETLRELDAPVDIVVFLAASDPLHLSVQHMLTAYGAETTQLRNRQVDPDRSPAEFLALQNEYGIVAGRTEDGRVVADASIVIAKGDKHWFVTTDDLVVYDEEDERARPALEQALTEGIRNVLSREKIEVCFTRGHQEISADDGGPHGLAELKFRLQKDNYTTRNADLTDLRGAANLSSCGIVVVAGPETAFTPSAQKHLETYFLGGGNLLVFVNPVLDEGNRIRPTGLERLLGLGGMELGGDFIIERDPATVLPQGLGETYFVQPEMHPLTRGLFGGDAPRFLPLFSAAQSLRRIEGGGGAALARTSPRAFSVKDIRPFVEEGRAVEKRAGDGSGPFVVGMASERPKVEGTGKDKGPRMVAFGSANLAFGRSWRDPTLHGNRVLVESAVSWLAAQPPIVSVPEKASHAVGLNLTEDDLTSILWYVLVHLPGAALVLGGFTLYRRRSLERRTRSRDPGPRSKVDGPGGTP
jgi:hypothetical protein